MLNGDDSYLYQFLAQLKSKECFFQESDEDDDKFFWYGVDVDNMNKIFLEILEGGRVSCENNIWLIFRDFIKVLLTHRKVQTRFHPSIEQVAFKYPQSPILS